MNRKLSNRERWLLVAVPAMVILGVYLFAVYRPEHARLVETERRAEQAEKDVIASGQVRTKRGELARLQGRLDSERRDQADGPKPRVVSAGVASWSAVGPAVVRGGEANALAKVSHVLADQNVVVLAAAQVAGDVGGVLPADLGESLKQQQPVPATAKGIGAWRLDLVGSYDNMRAALDTLAGLDVLVVPVGLCMEAAGGEDGDETLRSWKLWLWM